MLEFMPLAAGMSLLILLVGFDLYSEPGLLGKEDRGWIDSLAILVVLGFSLSALCALVMFMVSGIGWLTTGHTIIGLVVLFGRGLVSLGVLSFLPPQEDPSRALTFLIASMAMAAASTIALGLVTDPAVRQRVLRR
jgi:hypothetical protein